MYLNRRIRIQLAVFAVIALTAATILAVGYVRLPAMFGIGQYSVTMQLAQSGGLYPTGNVAYRGAQVGKVESVQLGPNGVVEAVLRLSSGTKIPSNLAAQVHSQSAIGEQYVELLPRDATSAPLKDGDVIPLKDTSVPPPVGELLDATNRGLQAIPRDSLKTTIDESFKAFGGLGPELSRIVDGSTSLAIDAHDNLDSLTTLIDKSAPVLDTQTDTADSVQAWSAHLADITGQFGDHDADFAKLIDTGGAAAEEARKLLERVAPTLPVLLANLVTVNQVAISYQPALEQLLVLLPQGIANLQGGDISNRDTKQPYTAGYLDFNLNLNLPPPCTTGFLPAQQRRAPALTDAPDRPAGDLYCRVPQDSPYGVRGARNLPCLTVPGKRAPTVKMCESDEHYVPLNDGYNWKGDPNATTSGQDIPQLAPGQEQPAPPAAAPPPASPPAIASAQYDPATGTYLGPDGKTYTQTDLGNSTPKDKSWQSMLLPPTTP